MTRFSHEQSDCKWPLKMFIEFAFHIRQEFRAASNPTFIDAVCSFGITIDIP